MKDYSIVSSPSALSWTKNIFWLILWRLVDSSSIFFLQPTYQLFQKCHSVSLRILSSQAIIWIWKDIFAFEKNSYSTPTYWNPSSTNTVWKPLKKNHIASRISNSIKKVDISSKTLKTLLNPNKAQLCSWLLTRAAKNNIILWLYGFPTIFV